MVDGAGVSQDRVTAKGIGHRLHGFACQQVNGNAQDLRHFFFHREESKARIFLKCGDEIDVAAFPGFATRCGSKNFQLGNVVTPTKGGKLLDDLIHGRMFPMAAWCGNLTFADGLPIAGGFGSVRLRLPG